MKFIRIVMPLLVLCLSPLYPARGYAQIGGQGSISGTITDKSGAVIPGAIITAINTGTNVKTVRNTSASGYYLLSPLIPGDYTVTVTARGFGSLTQEHITVDATQTVGFSPSLAVGSQVDTVTVTTAPPALETENGTLGMTMEQKEYTNLPLNMNGGPRNPTSFVGLMPGVQGGVGRSGEFNGSGSSGYLDEVYVDGMPITAPVQQGDNRAIAYTLSPEAVEQFQVQTSGSPVEFQGQGIQNYVIKSGTNDFHGSAFTFVRNTIFDTWGFSGKVANKNAITGQPVKPVEHQIEWGGAVGGPIIRNKLFFFTSYDRYFYHTTPNPSQLTVPTVLARTGDFTEYTYPIYDPSTTAACTAAKGVACRYPFQGMKNGIPTPNIIPDSRISAISQALQANLPAPSISGTSTNLYTALKTGTQYWKNANRIDYNINDKQRLSGILLLGNYNTIGPDYTSKLPVPYGTTEYVSQFTSTANIEHSWTLTPHLVNQFKFGFSRLAAPDVNATLNTPYTAENAGLTGLPAGEASSTFPAISFSGGTDNPTSWHAITGSVSNNEVVNTYVLIDNVQWVRGKHAFTFGGQIQWLEDNYKYPNNSSSFPMSYTFANALTSNFYTSGKNVGTIDSADTGVAYASFLLGAVQSSSLQLTSLPETGARFRTFAPYFQDDYKVSKKLTVNLGLRWDVWTTFREVHNRSAYFDPTMTNPLTGNLGALKYYGYGDNSCHCATPVPTWWKNIGPRVGFAYSINSKTVVRGAYGISYARQGASGGHNSGSRTGPSQQGFSGSTTLSGNSLGAAAFYWDKAPSVLGDNIFGTGSFPGAAPILPSTDPTQHTGNTSLLTDSSSNIVQGSSLGYGDPVVGRRAPYFQNFNFGVQRAFTNSTTLGVNYTASLGRFVPGPPRGYWENKTDAKYLPLGALLSKPANAANIAAAKQLVPGIGLPYSTFAGSSATIAQMLVAFPQYSSLSDIWGNVGRTSYHSLQLSLNQRTWEGMTFTVNYTYAKATGNVDDSRSGFAIPAGLIDGVSQSYKQNDYDYTWQSNAQKQRLVIYGVYELPFGKGRRFSGGPRYTRPLVNDWQFSSIFQYNSGGPISVTSTKCVTAGQETCYPDVNPNFSGNARQNGSPGDNYVAGGASPIYLKAAAFQAAQNYMLGNANARAPFNLWGVGSYSLDASLRKSFPIYERFKFTFQADCFNVPNKVTFGYASTSLENSSFGKTNSGSGNRDWQFAGRIEF